MTWLMSRLANNTMGYINWEPYISIMFVRFLRTFSLPVAYKQRLSGKKFKIDTNPMAIWIISMLNGDKNSAFVQLEKFMETLDSYFHPANSGRWIIKLRELLCKLSFYFVQRVHFERYKKLYWENPVPEHYKLTDEDIDRFVNILKPCVEQALFSRQHASDISLCLQYLSCLRPQIIIPFILEKLYASTDSLTEPHKLTSLMTAVISVGRPFLKMRASKLSLQPIENLPDLNDKLNSIFRGLHRSTK